MLRKNWLICLFIFLLGCASQKKNSHSGVLLFELRMQHFNSNEIIVPDYSSDIKMWYWGRYVIQRIMLIRIFDSADVHKWRSEESFYTFLDLKTRNYFRYSSFSDTAKMIQCCYTTTDSLGIEYGWNFFYKPAIVKKTEITFLTDTVLNDVTYKRGISFRNKTLPDKKTIVEPNQIYYFHTTQKAPVFTLNHSLTERTGYPVTRIDFFDSFKSDHAKFRWIRQIRFEADSLTESEKNVFKKWIENARLNSVKYNAATDSISKPKY